MDRLGLMIVEDDTFILEDLTTILDWDAEGYSVIPASNGKQGLHKFQEFRPMIVLTDVRMPVMDGLEMMARIKQQNPYVQFLVLSAYDDFAPVQEALRQGAKEFLLKRDITADILRDKLAAIRSGLEEQREFALNTVKNCLYEMLTAKTEAPETLQEQLNGVLRLGSYFPDEMLLTPARQFVTQLMKNHELETVIPTDVGGSSEDFFRILRACLIGMGRDPQYLRAMGMGRTEPSAVSRAREYIETHFQDPDLSTQQVANSTGMSYGRLSVLFREWVGSTLNDYLTEIRIREAKRLLCSGDYKIYEVAERVGYRSSQYFSYAFRQKEGQSPNHYKRGE